MDGKGVSVDGKGDTIDGKGVNMDDKGYLCEEAEGLEQLGMRREEHLMALRLPDFLVLLW
eukprot:6944997-Pyramimonas_sp.AAC.1